MHNGYSPASGAGQTFAGDPSHNATNRATLATVGPTLSGAIDTANVVNNQLYDLAGMAERVLTKLVGPVPAEKDHGVDFGGPVCIVDALNHEVRRSLPTIARLRAALERLDGVVGPAIE